MQDISGSIANILELLRWANCIMAGFAAVVGTLIAYLTLPDSLQIQLIYEPIIVFLSVFMITGSGNAINDYFDFEIDRVNRPDRPIPSGRISRNTALVISITLSGIGIALSYWLGPICLFLAVVNSILLYFYASTFKRTVLMGNIVIAYLSGSTFLFGGALDIFEGTGIKSTIMLFFLAGLATLSREIVKDIQDMEGDSKSGAVTLPVKIGKTGAARTAALAGLFAVILSPLPFLLNINNAFGVSYIVIIFVADMLFFISINETLLKDNAEKASKLLKMAMFLALIGFVVGTV
jgi:geranylgeranylglycerol-phosphate geranylgeranyltransferase